MPKLSSAQRTTRSSDRKRLINQPVKKILKTLTVRSEALVKASEQAAASKEVKKALIALDRAVTRGTVHRNNAARRKSRLMKKYNAAFAAQPASPEAK